MTEFFLYHIKLGFVLGLFYFLYQLFYRNEKFFIRNRFYLFFALLVGLLGPFLPWNLFPERATFDQQEIIYTIKNGLAEDGPIIETAGGFYEYFTPPLVLVSLYGLGVLFFFIRLLKGYLTVFHMIRRSPKEKHKDYILVKSGDDTPAFSFFQWIVLPRQKLDFSGHDKIIYHEMIHCQQLHSLDILLVELLIVFQWFNPFVWQWKKLMVENHEFLVDDAMLKSGIDEKEYQYTLIKYNGTIARTAMVPVNGFNYSLIKNRIKMMKKHQTSKFKSWKNIIILPAVVLSGFVMSAFDSSPVASENFIPEKVRSSHNNLAYGRDTLMIKTIKKDGKMQTVLNVNGKDLSREDLEKIGIDTIDVVEVHKEDDDKHTHKFFYYSGDDEIIEKNVEEVIVLEGDKGKSQKIETIVVRTDGDEDKDAFVFLSSDEEGIILKAKKMEMKGKNGLWTISNEDKGKTLYILNGKEVSKDVFEEMDGDDVKTISIIKGEEVIKKNYKKEGFDRVKNP